MIGYKKIYVIAAKAVVCLIVMCFSQETGAKDSVFAKCIWDVNFRWVNERELALTFKAPASFDLKSVYRLRIEPVFRENGEDIMTFPSLLYFTRKGKRFFDRRQAYHSTAESMDIHDVLVKNRRCEDSVYAYCDTLRIGGGYDTSGEVKLNFWLADCCSEVMADSMKVGVKTLQLPVVEGKKPEVVVCERFDLSLSLDYPWDESVIYPEYMDNKKRLEDFEEKVGYVLNDTATYKVERIVISGFASPEGGFSYNIGLSRRRALAFEDYLHHKYGVDKDIVSVVAKGENWNGLYEAVVKDTLVPYRDEVMSILKPYGSDAVVPDEAELKRMHRGKPYRYLLENIYPELRKMIMTVFYRKK